MGSQRQFGWQRVAACKGAPSYIFFPDEPRPKENELGYDPRFAAKDAYKQFCENCPVMWKCRQFAELHDLQGNWGSLSDNERHRSSSKEDREYLREIKGETGEYWPLYGHS